MSNDTQVYEHRISSALSRLSASMEALSRTNAPAPDPVPQHPAALDGQDEDLTRLLSEARDQHRAEVAELQSRLDQARTELDAQGLEIQRLRSTNVQLRESLRAQAEAAQPAPNADLQAEIEALRTARAAEISELNEILAELDPLIEAARPAQESHDA